VAPDRCCAASEVGLEPNLTDAASRTKVGFGVILQDQGF
jgi:hypothetical protein